ncbi:hypothetical protein M406DRAFT_355151 [Cryphonectria parasitica EP155]|uniref:Uncharacterized protein n=1 Tax=Cryphonectria parasitica (strain ATCC 38755 / EP155) TaxID=660469 RepID=A0A9P4Y9T1_CRYP1|nr:uncharacterized protein M406DRAFT_355151 [Cryphonectria parasitica EP155]KAF3769075.1 hypothetical protein M406DRAFT_355151 [Cryphonectria parasitica EP155]
MRMWRSCLCGRSGDQHKKVNVHDLEEKEEEEDEEDEEERGVGVVEREVDGPLRWVRTNALPPGSTTANTARPTDRFLSH